MFGIAAFMPFVLFRLLPMAEAAMVSQGIKAGPMRAAQQAHHTASIARHNPATAARRHHGHRGGGGSGGGHGAASGSGGARARPGVVRRPALVVPERPVVRLALGHQPVLPVPPALRRARPVWRWRRSLRARRRGRGRTTGIRRPRHVRGGLVVVLDA